MTCISYSIHNNFRDGVAGYENERGTLEYEMCYPSVETMRSQLEKFIQLHRDSLPGSVFIATDSDPQLDLFRSLFHPFGVL